MPPATKSGAIDSRPKTASANPSTPKAKTAATTTARKRRGLFAWFFGGKQPAQPVTIDASRKLNSAEASSGNEPAKAPPPQAQPVAVPEKRKEKAIDRLEKGYAEVTELVHALREHIDRQSDRSERLLKKMEHLPEALESLPKVSETNSQLLGTMQRHLDQQQEHSERLTQVIDGLVHASKHRDDAIDMLRQQFTAMQEKDTQLMNGFSTLGENMGKICDFQQKSASVLDRVMQMGAQAEQRMRDMLDINKRNARTLAMSGWALVVVSVAMTAFVAVAATRLASIPAAQTIPGTTQPVSGQDEAATGGDDANVTAAAPVVPISSDESVAPLPPDDAATAFSLNALPVEVATVDTMPIETIELNEVPLESPDAIKVDSDAGAFEVADLKAAVEGLNLEIDWNGISDRASQATAWLRPNAALSPAEADAATGAETGAEIDTAVDTLENTLDEAAPALDPTVDRVAAGESE